MNLLKDQEDYHTRYIKRTMENIQDMRRQGRRTIRIDLDQLEYLLMENFSYRNQITHYMEEAGMRLSYSMCSSPIYPVQVKAKDDTVVAKD